MNEIGSRLREARDRQNLTLADVAARTRIPAAALEHIEHNAFDRLPAAVFTKGHLRAYAAVVGLDEEEIVGEYLARWPAATHELPIFRVPAMEEPHDGRRIVTTLVGIAVMLFAYSSPREPGEPASIVPSERREVLVAQPIAARDVVDHAPAAAAAAIEVGVRLDVQPTDECWLSVVADGEVVIHRLLQKGERATIGAASELVVRIGDPGAFAYMLNGVPGRSLGDAGIPLTVTITEHNYRTFLDESEPEPRLAESTVA
jgi:cytoskeletal protein RodZ